MFKHEFEVIQGLIYPTLLGTDLLKSKGAKLDFTTNELQIGKAKASFDIPPWPKQNSQLVAIDDSILKPNSITLLRAEISGNDPRLKTDRPIHLLIGPLPSESLFDLSFLTSYSIIDPYMEEIIVEVMNPSAKPVHVCQGRPIASIEGENLEMSETGLARDLSKMPSDYSFLDNESDYHLQTLFDNPIVDGHTDTNLPSCSSSHDPIVSPYPVLANSLNCTSDGVELRKRNIKGFSPKGLLTREGLKRVHIDPAIAATDEKDEMTKSERENNTDENKTNTHRKEKETEKENEYVLRTDNTILGEEDLKELQRIIDKYSGIVAKHADDIGKTNLVYHYANLTSDTPICTPNYRTPPPHIRAQIDEETNRLLAAGVIRESKSPYSAPLVLVKKPDGSYRYCTDFRKINAITEKITFPVPNISDSLRRLKNPKIFSNLDLIKGYFQVPIAESHTKFYGFSDGKKHLEYLRTPMGSKNSGATMMSLMERLFRGFPPEFFLSYLDDILICTPCVKTHLDMLEKTFSALQRAGLKINPKKCFLAQSSVRTLGFVLSAEGISPDPKNLEKIAKWPVPRDVKQIRQFVGLTSYYRSHIKNYAKISTPLTDLLIKDKEFAWGETQERAFNDLKQLLFSGTACRYPDFDRPFILKTDGSGSSVGAVLSQLDSRGKEVIVAAASQKLNSVERKWSAFDKEYFSLIYGIRKFRHYLTYREFKVYTDSKPLISAININCNNDATGKRVRWSLELQTYNFKIFYKKGAKHSDADAMSRYTNPDPPVEDKDDGDILIAGALDAADSSLNSLLSSNDFVKKLIDGQNLDEHWTTIRAKIEQQKETDSDVLTVNNKQYTLIDNVLYLIETDTKTKDRLARICVPKQLISLFLNKCHGDVFSGHPGEKRLYDKLHSIAVWPGMKKDVSDKVRTCSLCQASRPNQFRKMVPVKPQAAQFPMQHVVADLIKFFPPSRGKNYILIFEDRFSKFCVMYPLADKSAILVAKKFTEFVTRFGCPQCWSSDNGGEFRNKIIEALCKVYDVKKRFGLAYHPPSQGGVERKNRTVIAELAKRVAQFGPAWADHLKWLEFTLNTIPHPSTGFTPFRLMFGREARTPFSSNFPPIDMTGWDGNIKTFFSENQKQIEKARLIALENHKKYREQMIRQTSKKGTQPDFPVGSQVWSYLPTESRSKLSLHYDGPWTVTEKIGNTYKIEKDNVITHRPHSDLKPYMQPRYENNNQDDNNNNNNKEENENDTQKQNEDAQSVAFPLSASFLFPWTCAISHNINDSQNTTNLVNNNQPHSSNISPNLTPPVSHPLSPAVDVAIELTPASRAGILDVTPPPNFDFSFDSHAEEAEDEEVTNGGEEVMREEETEPFVEEEDGEDRSRA